MVVVSGVSTCVQECGAQRRARRDRGDGKGSQPNERQLRTHLSIVRASACLSSTASGLMSKACTSVLRLSSFPRRLTAEVSPDWWSRVEKGGGGEQSASLG